MTNATLCRWLVSLAAIVASHGTASAQDPAASEPDTGYVEYRDSPLTLPLGVGLRIPSYDRVNGLTLPWGPRLTFGEQRVVLDALVSYRSHLGNWDPSLEGELRPGFANEIRLFAGRGTFTNDAWIRSDLVNSGAVLFFGSDARNHYRADRAALRYTRTLTVSAMNLAPFIGASFERGWSTGSQLQDSRPWSAWGRNGELKMRRPNPAVAKGDIHSLLGGLGIDFFRGELDAKLNTSVEHALKSPFETCIGLACTTSEEKFTQVTLHGTVRFPTFGAQTFDFRTHAVLTGSDFVPPQRYAYLGGSGTLATVDLLALGGDRLFFADAEYKIPLERIVLRFLGSPFLALRYAVGSAGVGELPDLIQNLGIGAGFGFLRVDYSIDPASDRSPFSRRSAFSAGVSIEL